MAKKYNLKFNSLINVAEDLIRKNGFSGLTMQDIIHTSRVSRGSVYSQLSNLNTVITRIAIKGLIDLQGRINALAPAPSARERLRSLQSVWFEFAGTEKIRNNALHMACCPAFREAVNKEAIIELDHHILSLINEIELCILQAMLKEGTFNSHLSPRTIAHTLWNLQCTIIQNSELNEQDALFTQAYIKEQIKIMELILNGLGWSFSDGQSIENGCCAM